MPWDISPNIPPRGIIEEIIKLVLKLSSRPLLPRERLLSESLRTIRSPR